MSDVFTVPAEKLISALSVLELIPARPGVASSQYIWARCRNNRVIFQLSSEMFGEVSVLCLQGRPPVGWEFFLDRRLFVPFILAAKKLRTEVPIEFRCVGKTTIEIRHGRRKAIFETATSISGYGKVAGWAGKELILADELVAVIRCVSMSSTLDPSVPYLNCVYLQASARGEVQVLASNQIVVHSGSAKSKGTFTVPFPIQLVPLLGRGDLKRVLWDGQLIHLVFPSGVIEQTVSQIAKKKFPVESVEKLFKGMADVKPCFRIKGGVFGRVVTRLSTYLAAVRRQEWLLELTGMEGAADLVLVSKVVGQGEFRETVRLLEPLRKAVQMQWPLHLLQPVFEFWIKEKLPFSVYGSSEPEGNDLRPYLLTLGSMRLAVARVMVT